MPQTYIQSKHADMKFFGHIAILQSYGEIPVDVAPFDPFVTYEATDERWLRFFGLLRRRTLRPTDVMILDIPRVGECRFLCVDVTKLMGGGVEYEFERVA